MCHTADLRARYASEVDVDFVRKSIKAIGQCAIRIEASAERCVHVLLDLIATRVIYVVQEAVVVMKVRGLTSTWTQLTARRIFSGSIRRDTRASFRPYLPAWTTWTSPKQRHRSFGSLASTRQRWTTRANCCRYSSSRSRRRAFPFVARAFRGAATDGAQVQLQTLTAVVKLYLQKPESAQGLVQTVLNTATKDCDSPDVRDRAYIYWRLLSTDPAAAKVRICVVLCSSIKKP